MTLQPQWDVGKSVFDAASSLRSLMAAGAVDDFQPQAVLAAERLGSNLIFDPRRIEEAVDALGRIKASA